MLPNERFARARAACDCPPTYGIAISCPMATLEPLPLVIQGDVCEVQQRAEFVCPRHEIMGW